MSRINIIGAACLDVLISPVNEKEFFSGRYKTDHIIMSPGGDALNEALVLSHFKADCRLVSILGNDVQGKIVLSALNDIKVSYNEDILKEGIETYVSLVLIDEEGERIFVGNREGSVRKLSLNDIRIDDDCEIVSFASVFISEELKDEQLCILFKRIKDRGITLCVDCSTPKHDEKIQDMKCLRYAEYFFCDLKEAQALCGTDEIGQIDSMFRQNGVNAVIKCGKDGAYHRGKMYPAERIDCVLDTTGAGDSFVAGFILSLSEGKSIEECIRQGNSFGGKACRHVGAAEWINHEECD